MQYLKNSQTFDAVSMSCAFIRQFVNMINCINFPCRGDEFSFVSIKLPEQRLWMELWECTVSCGGVLSVVGVYCQLWECTVRCGSLLSVVGVYCQLWEFTVSCGGVLSVVGVYCQLWECTVSCKFTVQKIWCHQQKSPILLLSLIIIIIIILFSFTSVPALKCKCH